MQKMAHMSFGLLKWTIFAKVFLFHTIVAQRTPTISYITPPIVSRIGGTIEMDCSVLYGNEYPVLWMKLPSKCGDNEEDMQGRGGDVLTGDFRSVVVSEQCTPIPLSSDSALIVRDNRFSMRYDTASATYTLQIKDVQRSDEAIYQCQIIVGINNKVTRHVKLVVSKPPVITDNSTRGVVVQENDPVQLLCHALGSPQPSVSWRRENNAILPTGGILYRGNILKIHSVKREDRGTYYCVADNGVGKPSRRNVAVDVEFKPVVKSPLGSLVGQAFGYSLELSCNVEAFPRPIITWSHNGIQLATNRDYIVDNGYRTADDFTETSVRIRNLGPNQLGSYFCRAQNKLGDTEQEIVVEQTYSPNCALTNCDETSFSGAEITTFIKPFNIIVILVISWLCAAPFFHH